MFTGIIEEIGTIRGIKRGNRSVVLEVQAKKVLEDLHVGDSICHERGLPDGDLFC